jgi:hypothetical protein
MMQAISNQKTRNPNTMLDWLDSKLVAENTDPPMIDMKYFAEYDTDFGFKVSVDGIHNVPNRSFYVVIISTNPPASLYTESKLPTPDVNLVSTYDWESPIQSIKFLDNYFYYQNI